MNPGLSVVLRVGEHEFLALIECRVYSAAPEKGYCIEDIEVIGVKGVRWPGFDDDWLTFGVLVQMAIAPLL